VTRRWALALLALSSLVAACRATDDEPEAAPERTLRVFAASSLTEAFTELGEKFESEHSDHHVAFQFAASSALARQIGDGAPADVFASADNEDMDRLSASGAVTSPRVIARNALAILVESGNPRGINDLDDLAEPGNVVVLCAPEVPCGRYAMRALAKGDVDLEPASLEENVKAVVSKVTLGEADAGIVYATDVHSVANEAHGIAIDDGGDSALRPVYPMATTTDAANPTAADAWAAFVLSETGQSTLADYGFLAP
jgi:molybdate transport system substrate-binding protein